MLEGCSDSVFASDSSQFTCSAKFATQGGAVEDILRSVGLHVVLGMAAALEIEQVQTRDLRLAYV